MRKNAAECCPQNTGILSSCTKNTDYNKYSDLKAADPGSMKQHGYPGVIMIPVFLIPGSAAMPPEVIKYPL